MEELNDLLSGVGVRLEPIRLYSTPLGTRYSRKNLRAIADREVTPQLLRNALGAAFNFEEKGKWVTFSWYSNDIHNLEVTSTDRDGKTLAEFFTRKAQELPSLVQMTCCLSHLLKDCRLPDVLVAAFALYSLTNPQAAVGQAVFDCVKQFASYEWVSNSVESNELLLCVSPQKCLNFMIKSWRCGIITSVSCSTLDAGFKRVFAKLSSVEETHKALSI